MDRHPHPELLGGGHHGTQKLAEVPPKRVCVDVPVSSEHRAERGEGVPLLRNGQPGDDGPRELFAAFERQIVVARPGSHSRRVVVIRLGPGRARMNRSNAAKASASKRRAQPPSARTYRRSVRVQSRIGMKLYQTTSMPLVARFRRLCW